MSPRLSLRVESENGDRLVRGSKQSLSRDDSVGPLAPIRRVRAELAENVIRNLRERERAIVFDVGRLRLLTGGQLLRLHFPPGSSGTRQGQRLLTSLVERRLLARLSRRIGGVRAGSQSYVYRLDVIGQRLVEPLGTSDRRWEVGDNFLHHALMVSECYTVLVEAGRAGLLELLRFEAEPACWRTFVSRRGAHEVLKPDASLSVGLGEFEDRWFVECDRSTEDLGRIRRKLAGYVRYWLSGRENPFPRVLWVCARPGRVVALAGVIGGLPLDQRQLFAVCQSGRLRERISAGAGEESESSTHNQPATYERR